MGLERVEITEREPLAGAPEGYVLLRGRAHFVLDPAAPANARIADLPLAAGEDGLVRFSSDLLVAEPPGGAAAPLFYVVANRGRAEVLPLALGAALPGLLPPALVTEATAPALGDGLLLRLGYRVVWCGWQSDLRPLPGLLRLDAPLARVGGASPPGLRETRIEVDRVLPSVPLIDSRALSPAIAPDPVADPADPGARLLVRPRTGGAFEVIPRDRFRFARALDGALTESAEDLALDGGFLPENVYELSYHPLRSPVHGVGLSVARDLVSALREDAAAVLGGGAAPVGDTFAFGVSQSGRYLRQFLFDGLNLDEPGRRVFDAMFVDIAGARRGDFNERYGQVSVNRSEGSGLHPPYAAAHPDGGLLDRQRALGGSPKVMFVNSAFEYWRRDASAIHTEVDGSADLPEDPEVRCYLLAGCSHVVGLPALGAPVAPTNPASVLDPMPALRALFVALARWVGEGVEPPRSRVPRVGDGSARRREEVLSRLGRLPGLALPPPSMIPVTSRSHPGAEEKEGDGSVAAEDRVVGLVAAVDGDGNERAGVVLPELAAPLHTHLAFNPRAAPDGGLVDLIGTSLAFPVDAAARAESGDPRPAVSERYPDRAAYLQALRRAARALAADALVLAEDEEWIVAAGGERFDALLGGAG
ncbi:MAG TPA: alpha/beta hydrolase domain-containing protein [Acidimicrobiales bacterium]|nr:alpha/beta hydrolase domain-containing protein [Acidimicrobiales bacterium]